MLTIDQKRLLFRATHRGTKEMDLVMERFVTRFLPNASLAWQHSFEALLALSDAEIMELLKTESATDQTLSPALEDLKTFYQSI